MENYYTFADHMSGLYNLLEDTVSRQVFWARLQFDCEKNFKNEAQLFQLTGFATKEELLIRRTLPEKSLQIKMTGKKLFLYGASTIGQMLGSMLLREGDFFAFCARSPEKYPNGVLGKPVYPPDYVFEHPDDCYVLISAEYRMKEIYNILMEHNFPRERIILLFDDATTEEMEKRQYFEFPLLFPKGTAFVDGGCFDCETSKRFAEWCDNHYSKILAFEPDRKNYQKCLSISDNSKLRLELLPFGLSDQRRTVCFAANGKGDSFVFEASQADNQTYFYNSSRGDYVKNKTTIQTIALDEVVQDTKVGFIKLDIEGSELSALHGAQNTILRDKPLMAVCVYHRCGDVLSIMDYLHRLVPEYHFWLRQYGTLGRETVLYAAINIKK